MKIIGVNLSAYGKSTSTKLVAEVLRGAAENGHETQVFNLAQGNLKGCCGCHACKLENATGCVLRDDMTAYFEALYDADVLVFGAGCYMGYPNGQAWDFMNRHFSLNKEMFSNCRIPAGKKLVAAFSQGVPEPGLYVAHYDALIEPFYGWGFEPATKLIATSMNAEAVLAEAYELGKSL